MKESISGIILAGGMNSRFHGQNKAFVSINGKPIIEHIINALSNQCDPLIIVSNQPELYSDYNALVIADLFPVRSSLTGIHSGLFSMPTHYGFFTACDTPFIDPLLVRLLIHQIERRKDGIVPRTKNGFQPLFALYSQRCLPIIESQIIKGDLKVQKFFQQVKIKFIDEAILQGIDPNLRSFININSPEDYKINSQREAPLPPLLI